MHGNRARIGWWEDLARLGVDQRAVGADLRVLRRRLGLLGRAEAHAGAAGDLPAGDFVAAVLVRRLPAACGLVLRHQRGDQHRLEGLLHGPVQHDLRDLPQQLRLAARPPDRGGAVALQRVRLAANEHVINALALAVLPGGDAHGIAQPERDPGQLGAGTRDLLAGAAVVFGGIVSVERDHEHIALQGLQHGRGALRAPDAGDRDDDAARVIGEQVRLLDALGDVHGPGIRDAPRWLGHVRRAAGTRPTL